MRLQNSRNKVLTGNRFCKIENTKVKDTYLHAFNSPTAPPARGFMLEEPRSAARGTG